FRRAEIQDVSTSAPNRIMWIMKNLDLGFIGDLSGAVNIVVPFNLTGQAEVQAEGLSVQLDSAQGVSDNVRLMLQGIICKKVRKYLDEDLNEKSISKEFYIDFRLREDPICGTNMVDLACAGEISYKGLGGTPFGPPPIAWLRSQSDTHMLMLQISDYLPNSLFYHAHKQRLIRLHLSPSSPGVSQFLRTSCENSFCLADLIPQLAETYPNHTLELSLASTRAPAVLFSEKKGGVISVNLGGVVVVFVFDGVRRKQAAVLDVEVVADAKLNLQGRLGEGIVPMEITADRNVSGSVELTKFELSSRSGTVRISNDELSDISILVSQLIENMLNEMLSTGFPLPLPHGELTVPISFR
ncbi:LBP / BPI / CETP family protein, partial [Teladorsagia circumcincta]